MKTAMQELHSHLVSAWSSPGDLWKPEMVIEKVKSMISIEKEQIREAYFAGTAQFANEAELINKQGPEKYYHETYS